MPSTQRKAATAAGNAARVSGVTGDQTVKATAALLSRLIVSSAGAAATLHVKDGAVTKWIATLPASSCLTFDFGMKLNTSLVITPSSVSLDTLVLYD